MPTLRPIAPRRSRLTAFAKPFLLELDFYLIQQPFCAVAALGVEMEVEADVKTLSPEVAPADDAPRAPAVETAAVDAAPSIPNEAQRCVPFHVFSCAFRACGRPASRLGGTLRNWSGPAAKPLSAPGSPPPAAPKSGRLPAIHTASQLQPHNPFHHMCPAIAVQTAGLWLRPSLTRPSLVSHPFSESLSAKHNRVLQFSLTLLTPPHSSQLNGNSGQS